MKIKTKLVLGVGLLFVLIAILATTGTGHIFKLSQGTKNILAANYLTLEHCRQMLDALDKLATDTSAVSAFKSNLEKQQNNITEPRENEATNLLTTHFEQLLKNPDDAGLHALVRRDLNQIMQLNMNAIQEKSTSAEKTADQATTWILITGGLCLTIAFILLLNMPGNISKPIRELTESIKQIAARNYRQRVHFSYGGEFRELAEAFNTMASKLEEYENSHLSKILFEKKRIETLINNMHEPIIGLDQQRKVLFANQEAFDILNLKAEELVGKHAWDVASTNDLMRSLVMELVKPEETPKNSKQPPLKIFSGNKESFFEKEIIPVDLAPTGEKAARHIGDVIILKNVTELQELNAARTNFISTVSQELRAPVSSILTILDLLENKKTGALNEEQKMLVGNLKEDGERLLKIAGTLLSLSQVETGNIPLTFHEMNPSEVMEYALETVKTQAAQKQINLVTNVGENLPSIKADTAKTAWVLTSFLVNAIRYSPEKSNVIVEVKRENGTVRFSVQDFGKGIEEKYKDKIFERYFRVPGSDKQGIGLALPISKEFIEAQGGVIGVESEIGAGSTFFIQLKV